MSDSDVATCPNLLYDLLRQLRALTVTIAHSAFAPRPLPHRPHHVW
jgi:hypothetical protein